MIGFIVPFRPIQNSKDWENDSALLAKTLRSICNQTSPDFKVYVIYHDLPANQFHHPNLQYVAFPYPFCTIDMLTDKSAQQTKDITMSVNAFDQGKKVLYGARIAINDGCNFIMSVDSDDLVSNKIAEFVNKNPDNKDGWFVSKGYIYMAKENFLVRKPSKMNTINGSTNIVAAKDIPHVNFDTNRVDAFTFFAAHGYLQHRLKEIGVHLQPLPFYAIIYVAHSSNWSTVTESYRVLSIRNLLIKILMYQPKFASIRKEFGL